MVLADLALGLLNRLSAQQLNVFFFSMPLKSILVSTDAPDLIPYALHHYLVESDKFYIYLKVLVSICMSEKQNSPQKRN